MQSSRRYGDNERTSCRTFLVEYVCLSSFKARDLMHFAVWLCHRYHRGFESGTQILTVDIRSFSFVLQPRTASPAERKPARLRNPALHIDQVVRQPPRSCAFFSRRLHIHNNYHNHHHPVTVSALRSVTLQVRIISVVILTTHAFDLLVFCLTLIWLGE